VSGGGRKPFQDATVAHVLNALRAHGGSRRFLVADEVGLGKTRVAQGLMESLSREPREAKPVRVFYMCSSLSIAAQNRDTLLKVIVDQAERKNASIRADRLDMLPSAPVNGTAPFYLYTLTPTTTGGEGTGRVDERVVIGKALQAVCEPLARRWAFLNRLCAPASNRTWQARWDTIQIRDRGVLERFRPRACAALGLADHAWEETLADAVESGLKEKPRATVEGMRRAMTLAVLEQLQPDLVIFDEFQRFFEMLPPAEGETTDEDDGDRWREAHEIMRTIVGARLPRERRPAVLMLSATPYRLFARMRDGQQHHEEFYQLAEFLFDDGGREVQALRQDFTRYRRHLVSDAPGSEDVLVTRDSIERRLLRVMCRSERAGLLADEPTGEAVTSDRPELPVHLEIDDVRAFRHLNEAARHIDFGVEPYWSSIPYPLQAMDRGYKLRQKAEPPRLRADDGGIRLAFKGVRRYARLHHPHPRLRGLLEVCPPELLALPWLPSSRPWWELGPPFRAAAAGGSASKALLFSRFRAVPRIVAAVLSYEAERLAFDAVLGSKRSAYDYFARSRSSPARELAASPVRGKRPAGLRRQPSPSFGLSAKGRPGENRRTLLMFLPAPALAALGNPLLLEQIGSGRMTKEGALADVRARISSALGVTPESPTTTGTASGAWRWVATLERGASTWGAFQSALRTWESGVRASHPGAAQACRDFLAAPPPSSAAQPSPVELDELAELALLGPGNVLLRAVQRVFGAGAGAAGARDGEDPAVRRLGRLLSIAIHSLRTYLDAPEWHRFLRVDEGTVTSKRVGYPEVVRQAIWNGNLEATLDEYLVTLQGLGAVEPDDAEESAALDALERALAIRDALVRIHRLGTRASDSVGMRCHAAMPFGLSASEVVDTTGALRGDTLRVAFNSPFRPMVLATTSIGQEGLDFHVYCRHVVHWDLPGNPIDLEQREGRVSRYGSLAVRSVLAAQIRELPRDRSPWHALSAKLEERAGGLTPWWCVPGAAIQRSVFVPSFSSQAEDLADLEKALALYRLTLGQSDQEHLLRALERRVDGEKDGDARNAVREWLRTAAVLLSPGGRGP